MAEQKLRRKQFMVTVGATVLGWIGMRAGTSSRHSQVPAYSAASDTHVRREPRAVPCKQDRL